ncbi:MAG: hypothetical protein IT379_09475 [Deltaproteobacteria bacterium]|nr:hypothetical protein [Deltaproteobacteria bacterium]
MDFTTAIKRAARSAREEARLYLVAISSLAVAFLCLGAALITIANLSAIAERWGQSVRLSIYLTDGADAADVTQMRALLDALPEVTSTQLVSSADARQQFLDGNEVGHDLAALPAEVFPSSVEVTLSPAAAENPAIISQIAERVARLRGVEQVETYRTWMDRLRMLVAGGRFGAGVLALLVGVCVLAIVGNTIRLSIANRKTEIEVLKLCGATDSFVRRPFLVEGAAQGLVGAAFAVSLLLALFLFASGEIAPAFAAFTGVRPVFLTVPMMALVVVGAVVVGSAGSALALRRYLAER